jgi:hypothetical protein
MILSFPLQIDSAFRTSPSTIRWWLSVPLFGMWQCTEYRVTVNCRGLSPRQWLVAWHLVRTYCKRRERRVCLTARYGPKICGQPLAGCWVIAEYCTAGGLSATFTAIRRPVILKHLLFDLLQYLGNQFLIL